ncbi:MAG: hypothetical protein ABI728_14355 [Betaproteobacteria bacterium]
MSMMLNHILPTKAIKSENGNARKDAGLLFVAQSALINLTRARASVRIPGHKRLGVFALT